MARPANEEADPVNVNLLGAEAIVHVPNALAQLVQNSGGLQHRGAGFHRVFITGHISSILSGKPVCKPLSGGTHDQLMERRSTYRAGFALDITLGRMEPGAAMIERLAGITFGAFLCTVASAQPLDDRVRELERRVELLERQLAQPSSPASASMQRAGQPEALRQRENWRALKRGMVERDVRSILGEPGKITAYGFGTVWEYPGGGSAQFGRDEKLRGWEEPR